MKSIKSLPSFAALALCLSVSSMASAATITPVNSAFTAPGTISVSSPASLNLPVTCNITFKGKTAADGSYASIDSVTVSGSSVRLFQRTRTRLSSTPIARLHTRP